MKKYAILFLFILIFSLPGQLFSAVMYDPDLEWKSVKTEHFWIHYHQGLGSESKKMAVIAEKVHKKLVPMIKWEPELRTDIVLIDNMYTANGFATCIPYNKVQIYITRPGPDTAIGNFDDWLEFVFTHEYTHILNMDTAYGFQYGVRKVFGRCCISFPNIFVPIWMIEGNAVYHESLDTVFGRNNSTYTDMILRMEIYKNTLKSISEASNFPRRWPTGNVPYLYGGQFVEYIERKYGRGTMSEIFTNNSNNPIPYSDHFLHYILPFMYWSKSDQIVIHESFIDVWDEWEEFIKIKYGRQLDNIKKEEITKYSQITRSGYNTNLPRFSKDGNYIYYIRETNYNMPALMRYSIPDSKTDKLCRINDPNSITAAPDGTLYLSDAEVYRTFSIYNEAYRFDSKYKKLTTRLRGSHIDISSDGARIVFIKNLQNRYSVIITDREFLNFKNIINESSTQISFTKFSPEGGRIVFTMKDEKGRADIAVLDLSKNEVKRLMEDGYNDIDPAWHPDGNRIIFSSDRNGIYNLYEYDLTNNVLSRITNVIGGAFNPDISPDGKTIAFASYNNNGFDISLLKYPGKKYNLENMNAAALPPDYFNSEKNESGPAGTDQSEDYSVWNSIAPPSWMPIISSDELYDGKTQWALGFSTPFLLPTNDTLLQHSYLFDFIYYTFEKRAQVDLYYAYTKFYPNFIIQYSDDSIFFGKDKFPWEGSNTKSIKREIEKSGIAGISFPFLYYHSMHILSFSYEYSETHTDIYFAEYDVSGEFIDREAKVRLNYSYDNTSQYSYSVSREDGRSFYLISEVYDKKFGSDLTYTKIFSEYAEYMPGIWKNNATMLRLRGGASFNNPDYKSPFNLGRFEKGKKGAAEEEEDSFGLRGYPSGLIYGNTMATGTLEYRFPVLQLDLGYGTIPVLFRDLWINIFCEAGNVWEDKTSYKEFKNDVSKFNYDKAENSKVSICDFKSSAGIELNMKITLGYMADIEACIGFARGFNKYGEDQIYFAVSTLYEGAFKERYKWLDYL